LTLNRVHNKMKQAARERIIFYCIAKGSLFCYTLCSTPLKPVVTVCTAKFSIQQDRQSKYNVILKGVRAAIVAVEKLLSITYYEFVFAALVNQNAVSMRHTVICGMHHCTIFFHIIS